jgi:16S rRNA (cytidine1402-2'-O)-methyltransferase
VTGARLLVVGTPIGNLDDLSPRAAAVLARADTIACEDTRRTGRLLATAGIDAPRLLAVHEHKEAAGAEEVVRRLDAGEVVALVTDAGMPAVSDPGRRVVAAAARAGYPVEVVPGPSAVSAALAVAGLPGDRFVFEGFLPRKGSERTRRLAALAGDPRTVVLYEAPHRLARTLADLAEQVGDREVVVARELTKLHEEVWRGFLVDAAERAEAEAPRGEHVLVIRGAPPPAAASDAELDELLAAHLADGLSTRDAASEAAAQLGVPRRRAYSRAVELSDD